MANYEAVLFDWSGTLVHDPRPAARLQHAMDVVGRDSSPTLIRSMVTRLAEAAAESEVADALLYEDTSAARHRAANMFWFARADLDRELAEALYEFDDDCERRPLYPDAAATLAALHEQQIKVAVVSDIHFDIRVHLAQQGVADSIDAYVLSFEHGCQKPDPKMFLIALDLLDVRAEHTLMVGDRTTRDGASVAVGIAALILPPPPERCVARGLDVVTRMVSTGARPESG
jgi:HAD superfamily hydrolase (TIGR01549 family)